MRKIKKDTYPYLIILLLLLIVLTVPGIILLVLLIKGIFDFTRDPSAPDFMLRKITVFLVFITGTYLAAVIMKAVHHFKEIHSKAYSYSIFARYKKNILVILILVLLNAIMFVFYPPCGIIRYMHLQCIFMLIGLILQNIGFIRKMLPFQFDKI